MSGTLLRAGISNEEDLPGAYPHQIHYLTPLMRHCSVNSYRKDKLSYQAGGNLNVL